jgi:hypothetical protein
MAIYNTQITATTAGSANTLASGTGARAITTVIVCNTGATDLNLTMYAVPTGGSTAGVATMIINALIVPAGDMVSFDQEKMVLATGDELKAICSASGLTATVSTLAV